MADNLLVCFDCTKNSEYSVFHTDEPTRGNCMACGTPLFSKRQLRRYKENLTLRWIPFNYYRVQDRDVIILVNGEKQGPLNLTSMGIRGFHRGIPQLWDKAGRNLGNLTANLDMYVLGELDDTKNQADININKRVRGTMGIKP